MPRGGEALRGALAVGEVATLLKETIEGSLGQVWIKGEVSGLKRYQSGHWYFALRDPDAQVRCVMWRTYTAKVREVPSEGTEVYVLARPTVWEEKGELRLSVVVLLPTAAIGLQEKGRERTRAALERDGLLTLERKRPLPRFPRAMAVVTSVDGAVLHDILTVRRSRWPLIDVLVVPTRVQGDRAAKDLVRALGIVNDLSVDLCILARGGGGRDDLIVFDDEEVCRAVAKVTVPVISAVGHETDVALVDLVADRRAATPSAAVEMALPDRAAVIAQIDQLASRMANGLARPTRLRTERILRTTDRMIQAWERHRGLQRERIERLGAQLDALSPLAVLGRGYSVIQSKTGEVLRSRTSFTPGMPFTVRLRDGSVPARAEDGQ